MSQKRNNKQSHWASRAASATKEQAQEPISWEEPPLVEHLDTQEEHTLVGPSSLQHQLGEKEVNVQIWRSGSPKPQFPQIQNEQRSILCLPPTPLLPLVSFNSLNSVWGPHGNG